MAEEDMEDCRQLATLFFGHDYDTPSFTKIVTSGPTQSQDQISTNRQGNKINHHLAPKPCEIHYEDLDDYRQAAEGKLHRDSFMDDNCSGKTLISGFTAS
jgi:hypothetical protein